MTVACGRRYSPAMATRVAKLYGSMFGVCALQREWAVSTTTSTGADGKTVKKSTKATPHGRAETAGAHLPQLGQKWTGRHYAQPGWAGHICPLGAV